MRHAPYTMTAIAALILAACGAPETDAPSVAVPETAEPAPEVTAQGFITANTAPPATAVDERGDGVYRDSAGRPFQYALLGEVLPEFTAPMADGSVFDSASLSRWTVIDIWGAWCADCVADGPYVAALERAIAQDPDLDFISIHVPASAARATPDELYGRYGSLSAYFAAAGYEIPTVLDTDASLRSLLRVSWTPSYLLVGPDRVVRGFRTDLSVVDDQPVKTFLQDVARVRAETGTSGQE